MKKNIYLALVFFAFFYLTSSCLLAQSLLREIPLKQQVENSSLIVEGKVISKTSFWDDNYNNIYTVNTVEVSKVFKGEKLFSVEVITLGGSVNGEAEFVSPSLKLYKGDVGLFMLYKNNTPSSTNNKSAVKKYRPYSSSQGFYRYNLNLDIAVNPFSIKVDIARSFYEEIKKVTQSNYQEISSFDVLNQQAKIEQSKSLNLAPSDIVFSPTTSTAGTGSVSEITITGNGFGIASTPGKVGFSNADDGGATFINALDSQIISWSDTEIRVQVPSGAGTGPIRVTNDDSSSDVSAGNLVITFSELNVVSNFYSVGESTDYAYQARHIDDPETSGSGGYTWEMFTDFFDDSEHSGAKASFERALDTWRCDSEINWDVSASPTTVDVIADDDVNVVRFDNGAELEDGIAGRCYSRWSSCGFLNSPTSAEWHVTEMDIVFDSEINWETGPAIAIGSKVDFESVALHELGHGHQLGHVIDASGAVMHYSIANAENIRTLTSGDSAGANDVQSRSTSIIACSLPAMTNSNICNLSTNDLELTESISIFPNPSIGAFFIKNSSSIILEKAVLYDVSGRQISEYNLSNDSNINSFRIQSAARGIYFVKIFSEKGEVTRKIIQK